MRRRDFMSFVWCDSGLAGRRARAATRGLRPQRRAHNGLGSFELFLCGSRRNLWRLRRVEDRHPILANRGTT